MRSLEATVTMNTDAVSTVMEIGRFRKSATEEVRITLEMFHGREILNARVWWINAETGEWQPSKKGLAISTSKLPDLLTLLTKAMETARPMA